MNWIVVAIIVLISSTCMYLFVRKSKLMRIKVEIQNLGLFLVPMILYLIYNLIFNVSLIIELKYIFIILVASVFFSWVGNICSLKAIEITDNPGYSLIISKSYVILTTVCSIFLFNSAITTKNIIAIFLVIFFVSFIIIEKKKDEDKKDKKYAWLVYTIIAFFCFGFLSLVLTYLGKKGVNATVTTFYLTLFVSLLIIGQIVLKKIKVDLNKKNLSIFFGIGIPSAIFNFALAYGYTVAPNPGYISVANVASIALLTVLYKVIFKDILTVKKIVGIIGVLIGLIMIFI